jgi:hypothetical protein
MDNIYKKAKSKLAAKFEAAELKFKTSRYNSLEGAIKRRNKYQMADQALYYKHQARFFKKNQKIVLENLELDKRDQNDDHDSIHFISTAVTLVDSPNDIVFTSLYDKPGALLEMSNGIAECDKAVNKELILKYR